MLLRSRTRNYGDGGIPVPLLVSGRVRWGGSFLLGGSLLLSGCLFLSGCAAGAKKKAATPDVAALQEQELDDQEEESSEEEAPPPDDIVADAARPFSGYRPADGLKLDQEALITFLASADAICIGERHDKVIDHYAEWRLVSGMAARRPMRGFELGVALEMVRRSEQPTLRSYSRGTILDEDFEKLSRWKSEWGFPVQYYLPSLRTARDEGAELVALGVARSLTRQVAKGGLGSLSADEAQQMPELDATSATHRALFDSMMAEHPMEGDKLDFYYEAQLIWDESMADTASAWLAERSPGRKLVIMAGTAHCHRDAIPARVTRRTGLKVVSVLPVDQGSALPVVSQPKSTEERLVAGYDYQMVFGR